MSEWWTYALEDFLLFSPRVYWRMFELHNEAVWPLHVVALLLGSAILVWVVRPRPWSDRAISVLIGIARAGSGGRLSGTGTPRSTGPWPMWSRCSPWRRCCWSGLGACRAACTSGPVGPCRVSLGLP